LIVNATTPRVINKSPAILIGERVSPKKATEAIATNAMEPLVNVG
jgi:hypothetical protein